VQYPQNNTFANRCKPAQQTKVYKRVVFCQRTNQYFGSISYLLPFYSFYYICILK